MFHFRWKPRPPRWVGPGDARPRGRFLGDHQHAGDPLADGGVGLLQERHRVEVLVAAVDVRQPLAVLAGVVQVQHRCDGIDPQPVDVVLLQPVQRVRDQEVADLAATEVEDEGAPVGLLAAPRVGVLVQRGAVEPAQRPLVLGEVRRHPVQDDADAGLVQPVDQVPQVVRRAEAGVRGVVRGHLVAPGRGERVAGQRQELDVGEPGLGELGDQLVGHLPVVQAHLPGPGVDLVDRQRPVELVGLAPGRPSSRRRSTRAWRR